MNFLTSWIKNIILVVLFANFIDLILPKGKMAGYVRIVISFMIMAMILNPLLVIFKQDLSNLDLSFASQEQAPSFSEIVATGESLKVEEQMSQQYKDRLIEQIKALIKLNKDLEKIEVEVFLAKQQEIEKIIIRTTIQEDKKQEIKQLIKAFYMIEQEKIKVKTIDRGE